MKLKLNTIGFRSGFISFLSFGTLLAILLMIIIKLITIEFTKTTLEKNVNYLDSLVHIIDSSMGSYLDELDIEANKSIIINTVMNPSQTQFYIEDYINEITLAKLRGDIYIMDYNYEPIYQPEKQYDVEIDDVKTCFDLDQSSVKVICDDGLIGISSPSKYNSYTEGYLLYLVDFKQVFSSAYELLFLEKKNITFNAYYNDLILHTNGVVQNEADTSSIIHTKELETIPIRIELKTPISAIKNPVDKLRRNFIMIALAFSIISVVVIIVLSYRSIATPLKKLRSDIEMISNNQLEEISIDKKTINEIRFVENSFNAMHKKLQFRTNETLKVNQDLKSAQKRLIQSEKMASIGQLAAGVAHEINNPTGFVSTNLETLKEYTFVIKKLLKLYDQIVKDPQNKDKLLEEINKIIAEEDLGFILDDLEPLVKESLDGTNRIRSIVNGLRDFARKGRDEFEIGNVNSAIEAAIKLTWNEIKYKCNVNQMLRDLPDTLCNLDQLTQVFVNLLINSSHAISENGQIYIYTQFKDNMIIVRFSDNGCGIEKENINRLFDPFFSTKEVGKGTGLGLSISHGIVQKHGGTIEVKSKVNYGTCIVIKLPFKEVV